MTVRDIIAELRDRLAGRPPEGAPAVERQAGAIPYDVVEGQVVFLIVTTRRTGRWIFPKGRPREGKTPQDVVAREARDEAGVVGRAEAEPVGVYRTYKTRGVRRFVIEVDMYPLRVARQLETWKEKDQRYRHWVVLAEAKRLLSEPKLAELAELVARRARHADQNAAT